MRIVHVTHMTEFISHICVRHATRINKYATHLNEIRRTYKSTSHVTYMNASWHSACLRQQYEMQRRVPGYQKLMKSSRILGTWDDHDFGINDGVVYPPVPPPLFLKPRFVSLYSCVCVLISKDDAMQPYSRRVNMTVSKGEVGGWGRVPFSRNLMSPTPRRKWYLTMGRRAH